MYRKIALRFRTWNKFALPAALSLLLLVASAVQAGADLPAGGLPHLQTAAPSGRIVIKLNRSSGLVMDSTGLIARPGAKAGTMAQALAVREAVAAVAPGARLVKRIPTAPVLESDQLRAGQLPDLALYAHFTTTDLSRQELVKIAARLNALPEIELAFLEPVAVPAALGFDAFTGATPAPAARMDDPTPPTADFSPLQGYLGDAPMGVGALSMRPVAGQRGAGVTVIDVEGAWLWTHEDLPTPVADLGVHIDDLSWRNHGTAVMGEIRGQDNGFGVVGITPDCQVGNSSIGASSTAGALAAAVEILSAGDLILIELHAPGPNADGNGQFGYLPMEFWQDNFDVIRLATSRGILVCEAAGNGYQNLDGEEYLGLFDRQVRDSGAIMCGATAGSELYAADFSNHGARVDLNGWGWYVTTSGYGDLQSGTEQEYYTEQFSGTSSASPIVTGSVASLQGMVRQLHGFDLDARLARDILRQTGTVMSSGHLIGTRPNLSAAYTLAAAAIGEVSGTVTDLADGTPQPGVLVQVADGGSFTVTDEIGHWRLPLQDGPVTLDFSSFYYRLAERTVSIIGGESQTLEVALEALPLIDITGTIYTEDLNPLAAVVVTPTNQPVTGAVSGSGGVYTIVGLPTDHVYQLLFDGLPGYGAQVINVDTGGLTGDAVANLKLPFIHEDFESGGGGFSSSSGLWTHGTPPAAVTGSAFSGSQCWGVGMDGDYADNESDQLLSPVYDLSSIGAASYLLSFHFYCATEAGFDGVNLEVSSGGPFAVRSPLDGYTDLSLGGLGNLPGWAGDSNRWRGAVFDITDFLGESFQFRLNWGSDSGVTEQGFYLDGIAFGTGWQVSSVQEEQLPPQLAASLKAWPNPFNPRVTLEYALAKPGPLHIVVYDVRGRQVKVLLDLTNASASGTLEWDGNNQAGNRVPSGVYFVLAASTEGGSAVSRVVLAK